MGSPYHVHTQVNRIHVVTSSAGFERIRQIVIRNMGGVVNEYSPEWRVLNDLQSAYTEAMSSRSRSLVFLEARYEWQGWEKFQRVIVFDFSGKRVVS